MGNPFFQAFGNSGMSGPMGSMQRMIQQFQQFRQSFQGDPKAEVEKMLREGRITQQQVDQAQQMARQLSGFLK